jgi:hypothetical protein
MKTIKNRIHAYLQKKLFAIAFAEGVSLQIGKEGVSDNAYGTTDINLISKRAEVIHILPLEEFSKVFAFEVVLAHEIGHCVSYNEKGFSSEWSANQWAKKFIRSLPFYIQPFLSYAKRILLV